jgi:UDP-3-O-[3-hydroxymyristoyl] glucosamine N-acyltransferase
MGGHVGIADHAEIGNGAILGPKSGVHGNVPAGATVIGYPQREAGAAMRIYAAQPYLPELMKRIRKLEKQMDALKE